MVLKRHWSDFKLYSHATSEGLDELEASLQSGACVNALWTDLPGNPTLVTPDMHRLRRLADEYDFLIICDETVGTFINTDLLPYVDVLVTSLTKIYSGFSDVLAGRYDSQYMAYLSWIVTNLNQCGRLSWVISLRPTSQSACHFL